MLARLKALEQDFGRRRGRRWGPRVLDLDIVLWSGGEIAIAAPARSASATGQAELRPAAARGDRARLARRALNCQSSRSPPCPPCPSRVTGPGWSGP